MVVYSAIEMIVSTQQIDRALDKAYGASRGASGGGRWSHSNVYATLYACVATIGLLGLAVVVLATRVSKTPRGATRSAVAAYVFAVLAWGNP